MSHIQATVFYMIRQAVKYGLLYNWYVVSDARNICNTGWHIWTLTEANNFITYVVGADPLQGKNIRETGTTHWIFDPGATNLYKFNLRGAGQRTDTTFLYSKETSGIWINGAYLTSGRYVRSSSGIGSITLGTTLDSKAYGFSLRPVKDTTILTDGEEGIYQYNDGKTGRTICINGIEYLADNLEETKFGNGDDIPEVTDQGDWAALTDAAMCAYDNDWNNV